MADSETLLEVRGLKKHFGGLKAVDGVDLTVKRGETLGLIGPNGAGKTTFFNMVCGFYTPTEGTIRLNGDKVELWYGDLHRLNGNYLAAISQYKKAGELYPATPYKAASLRLIGDIYADNLKDTANATAYYTRVLREFPGSSERVSGSLDRSGFVSSGPL